jgi:hypothetical protein
VVAGGNVQAVEHPVQPVGKLLGQGARDYGGDPRR